MRMMSWSVQPKTLTENAEPLRSIPHKGQVPRDWRNLVEDA